MSFFVSPFQKIYRHRKILFSTTLSEIRKKYAGSALGIAWAFLYPLLFLGVYAAIYSVVLGVTYPNLTTAEYILVIFCGLIPFLGFSEAINSGTQSVTANSSLIKNTMFPIELIPVRTVLCAQLTHGAGIIVLLATILVMRKWTVVSMLILIIWFLQILMEIGIVWILSSINVVMKDLQNVISIIVIMLMMISPIAYPVSAIPENLRKLMAINPIYNFITSSQKILVYGEIPEIMDWIGMVLWGPCVFLLGYQFFIRMKKVFVDNV